MTNVRNDEGDMKAGATGDGAPDAGNEIEPAVERLFEKPVEGSLPTNANYEALAEFRRALREFSTLNEASSEVDGITVQRYQALLAIRARGEMPRMTVGELAQELSLKPHSAAELVNRLEGVGLVRRVSDTMDRRKVLLALTEDGANRLARLVAGQIEQIEAQKKRFKRLFELFRNV